VDFNLDLEQPPRITKAAGDYALDCHPGVRILQRTILFVSLSTKRLLAFLILFVVIVGIARLYLNYETRPTQRSIKHTLY
jgi:hypothetical protein